MKPVSNQQVIESNPLVLQGFRPDSPRFVLYGCAILLVLRQAWIDGWCDPSPHPNPPPLGEGARPDRPASALISSPQRGEVGRGAFGVSRHHNPLTVHRVAMDFGFTFTAANPDGHRLRVFAPTAA